MNCASRVLATSQSPLTTVCQSDPANSLCYVPLTSISPKPFRGTLLFSITYEPPSPVTTFVMYHLRDFTEMPQKPPSVFYHLQTIKPVSPFIMYHLRKKPGGGAHRSLGEGTVSRTPNRPCLTPLDSYTSRPCAARPCLSPFESHSYKKRWGYP
jgi:hypothetical protein